LGHISRPLSQELIKQGQQVTVISSNREKQKEIEELGATAAIGSVKDPHFLREVFTGADAVYCMIPPSFAEQDQIRYYESVGTFYAEAIERSGIKRVVHLSSYGADLETGTGFITGAHKVEKLLDKLPNISLTHIRATYFYYNLFNFIKMIRTAGFIGSVYGGEDKLPMVSPVDIAFAVAEEITRMDNVKKVRYVVSDERTCNEVAEVLGKEIGIDLKWHVLPQEQVMQALLAEKVPENAAHNLVELGTALHQGILRKDFEQNKPKFGMVRLEDFAHEFGMVYNQHQ
jgi:uncharacterized protein YbjT (DUF2867 family)